MEIAAEVEPTRSPAKLERMASAAGRADWADVPDSPMGVPRADSLVVACMLKCRYGLEVVPHVRVIDRNRVALYSAMGSAALAGFKGLVFLRGDRPGGPVYVEDLTPEQAAAELKRRYRGVLAGLILSMRKGREAALARLTRADFFVVTNAYSNLSTLEAVSKEARRLGVKLYPYVVVATPRNSGLVGGLADAWRLEDVPRAVARIWGLVDGVIVSAPGDWEALEAAIRAARREAGGG